MTKYKNLSFAFLRVGMGWLFFYAGITKLINPEWSAAGYLSGAKTFPGFFEWLAMPDNLIWVNLLNEWGLTFVGFALLIGVEIKWASLFGGLLMLLYWLPVLDFPFAGSNNFFVNDHIIYILALWALASHYSQDRRTIKSLLGR